MVKAKYVYSKSDGRFIGGGFYDAQPPLVGDPPAPDYVNYGVAEFADADVPGQTDMYDPATGGKRPMSPEELALFFPPPVRSLSRFEFMGLLTPQERIALRTRAAAGDVILADALDMLGLAAHVEVSHPLVEQMLGYVQSIGVMSAERRQAFVAAMAAAAK
jgi:hypothetical protein